VEKITFKSHGDACGKKFKANGAENGNTHSKPMGLSLGSIQSPWGCKWKTTSKPMGLNMEKPFKATGARRLKTNSKIMEL